MKFNELTEEDKKYAEGVYKNKSISWDERMFLLTERFGVSERTARKWCSNKLHFKEKNTIQPDSEQYNKAQGRKTDKTKSRFIITWAQNNTPIHEKFFRNIEAYANYIDADIHIIAGRYKNPTSVFQDKDYEFWDERIEKYLDANRHNIHKYVSIMSDVKIQPTAVNPMTGLQGMSGVNSCVFGSPKVQMEMIPVLDGCIPKMMVTTGAVTNKNYTDSKSGKLGEFHHVFGFVIIEIKDKNHFFIRQVTANDTTGCFYDLYNKVDGGIVSKIDNIEAIVLGDLHSGMHDEVVLNQTIELMGRIKPKHVVLHDVFDGYSINHHTMKNPFIQFGKEVNNTNNLKNEIDLMVEILGRFKDFQKVIIVRSNHDDFIDRWLSNDDWKKQPTTKNSIEYMKYSTILLEQHANNNVIGVIPHIIKENYPDYITLNRRDSYKIKGFEVGQHGDIGISGTRGSANQFRKLNSKMITGHSHTPSRKDGLLVVGTTTKLRLDYNIGPSSWLNSHIIIHEDGRAQHISFINGEYTTLL